MCLQLLEYVCVKQLQNKLDKSTAIVSEFAGCIKGIGGTLITNPYDIENISNKLEEAINMSNV
jgi:trehalose-6-phosphate synthase